MSISERVLVALIAIVVCAQHATRAQAVLLTVNGTTVFNDGFEGGTVGSPPSTASPGPGTWSLSVGGGSVADIYGPASGGPGAALGNQYLRMFRPSNGGGLAAFAPVSPVNGDVLHAEAWMWISTANDHGMFWGFESDDLSHKAWASTSATPGTGGFRVHHFSPGADLSDVKYATQTWQLWTIDYTVGSSQYTLGVNGVTQTFASLESASPITRLRIACSNPTTFYVDGPQPIPEPNAIALGLFGFGLVGLAVRKVRLRK